MIKVVVINENGASVQTIEDGLDEFYRIIGCDLIDIARRKVQGKWFDIIVDDEGLLKDETVTTAVSVSNPQYDQLVGTLIVSKANEEGEQVSLTDEECEVILNRVRKVHTLEGDELNLLLMD